MQIKKIVITGGPCAGKTTAMGRIQKEFAKIGYCVLFVPETATELITGGVAPWTCASNEEYQQCQILLQKGKEKIFERAAAKMNAEKLLIVCDRGVMDNRAYMNDQEFADVMQALGLNEIEERDQYDAVFHLVTAANGALQAYTLANNAARIETPEQAVRLDEKVIAAWTGHPYLRVIDNSTSFEEKLNRLIREIAAFLGEEMPVVFERKYLIRYPDVKRLEALPNCEKIQIVQTYLRSPDDTEIRIRKRGRNGQYLYFRTELRRVSEIGRTTVERRITQEEYKDFLMDADPARKPVRKTRYCLTENNRYFEIDIFPEWSRQAVMDLDLHTEDETFAFPSFVDVIREVSGEKEYSNYAFAISMPDEEA